MSITNVITYEYDIGRMSYGVYIIVNNCKHNFLMKIVGS